MDVVARNNVVVMGEGPATAVLVHGLGLDQTVFRHVAPALARTSRVVLLDLVGSGRSRTSAYDPVRYADLDGYARDVVEVAEALDLRGAVFVGHSVGGVIALRAALAAPERCAELALIGASARYLDDPPDYVGGFSRADVDQLLDMMDRNYLDWAQAIAPRAMDNPERPELRDDLERRFGAADRGIVRRFAAATFLSDTRPHLGRVPVRTVVFQSARDIIVPLAAAEYIARGVPDGELVMLDAFGHYPTLSAPEEVIARLHDKTLLGSAR